MLDIFRVSRTLLVLMLLAAGCNPTVSLRSDGDGAQQLEMVRGLVGDWAQLAPDGSDTGIFTSFRETAGGSAIEEVLFGGTDHEMVTIYHVDGGRLMLTHYCVLANQPRLVARSQQEPSAIQFDFLDGTGMDPAVDAHMHEARIEFADKDHFSAHWTSFSGGESTGVAIFQMTRVDSSSDSTP